MIRQPTAQPLLLTMAVTIAVAVTVPHSRTLCCAVWQAKSTIELDLESPDAEDRHCGFVDVCSGLMPTCSDALCLACCFKAECSCGKVHNMGPLT